MQMEWQVTYNEGSRTPFELRETGSTEVVESRVGGNAMIAELMDRGVSREVAAEAVVKAAREAGAFV